MSDEFATPGLAQMAREAFAAATAEDLDGTTANLAPDAVWEMDEVGLGPFRGVDAIRTFLREWWSLWSEHRHEVETAQDLGQGIAYVIVREHGRMKGSDAVAEARVAHVIEAVDGRVVRDTTYIDMDEARTAAERLARERD